jgi:hypothetical protein
MHPIDQDGLKQITEELLACGVHLDEPREPIEVGILEPTADMAPREPRARRPSRLMPRPPVRRIREPTRRGG